MQQREWWRGATIYQVYLPSFFDGTGDGMGDLPGLRDQLGYIADLGADAIWISPFYRSPMRDFGYDVADYRSVEPQFGTLDDIDQVVARAHGLGMRVLVDQVWSHTASDHPWFRNSRSSRANDKADWYVWADPRPDGSPPNNWLSVFGGSAWQWDAARRQYYLHHFLPTQPKLNLRNQAVLAEHFATAKFWLDRGIDGFRIDAVDFMLHDETLRDNPLRKSAAGEGSPGEPPWNPFRMQHHLHDMCHPDADALMREIRRFMDRFPEATTIGEISSEAGALRRVAAITGGGTRLHMAYTLGVMKAAFSASTLRQALVEAGELNRSGWLCWSFTNHDVARVVSRWNPKSIAPAAFARLQMALLLTLPGSICLYQGEELGLPNADIPPGKIRDPFGLAFYPVYAGRDGSRTPLPWVAGAPNSGFSIAPETWLPLAPEHDALAIDCQERDQASLLHDYRRMLAWRKRHSALMVGELTLFDLPDPILGFRRRHGSDAVVALFNLSPHPVTISLAAVPSYRTVGELAFATKPETDQLVLPPFGLSLGVA